MDRPKRTRKPAPAVPPVRRTRSRQLVVAATNDCPAESAASTSSTSVFSSGSFERAPLELLQYICELAAGPDVAASRARRMLCCLRLVNKRMCLVASRVAHTHIVVTRADHARHLLNAILLDAKKGSATSQTTFYAFDITALTIRDRGKQDRSTISVLLRLPTAIRRLPKLKALTWAATERPTVDLLRALAKAPHLRHLEICDTEFINAGSGAKEKLAYETYARVSLFPQGLSTISRLTHLTLRLKVNQDGQYGSNNKWREFCGTSLAGLEELQSLVVQFTGQYEADCQSLCTCTWPHLRRLGLKGIRMRFGIGLGVDPFMQFLERHASLEDLDIDDPGLDSDSSIWPAVSAHMKQQKIFLPNLRRLAISAMACAGFVQNLLFKGFRPLTDITILRSWLLNDQFKTLVAEDGPHVAMRAQSVHALRISLRYAYDATTIAEVAYICNVFSAVKVLHLHNFDGAGSIKTALLQAKLPNLESFGMQFSQNRDAGRQYASSLADHFRTLREMHAVWCKWDIDVVTAWAVMTWTPRAARPNAPSLQVDTVASEEPVVLDNLEVQDRSDEIRSGSLPWPMPSTVSL
ncbi:hypothetical protein EXIGLDRAFT_718997 [Exidia glandulosa HHB12029]|uniref:F-box domain-containing protein n=1 Tax=Exidia glandulosa HHB12029 TaxID=1314781 RepID=A0A165NUS9_EXIGL|nr:hypothetical protein EXIGLDRAFT_718997 [Exidia glandulosa HHB12029]